MDLLIGHTGFVGTNLKAQHSFDKFANSSSIEGYRGASCDLIVNCGVSAVKWMANKDPEADRLGIEKLKSVLDTISARRFVHISTIDVFAEATCQTEQDKPERAALHPYGLHRIELEDFIRDRFETAHIIRLPALFGKGLKKNILFDLMNRNMTNKIAPNTVMQWYPVARLWSDIEKVMNANLDLVHLAPPPLETSLIIKRFFPDATVGAPLDAQIRYDFHTSYSEVFGSEYPYIMSVGEEVSALDAFISGVS